MTRLYTKLYLVTIVLLVLTSQYLSAQQLRKPDSIATSPFFPVFSRYSIDSADTKDVKKISIDIEIKTTIPDGYHYCISALNADFNGKSFHLALATHTNGIPIELKNAKDTVFGQGAVFTRWGKDADINLIKTKGFTEIDSGHTSIRNEALWNKGRYRITLSKSGYTEGKPIPSQSLNWEKKYPLTEYEHTWFAMSVENLETRKKWLIGTMAFPGKTMKMTPRILVFLEQYGPAINYGAKNRVLNIPTIYYKDIPKVQLVIGNLNINGKKQRLEKATVNGPKAEINISKEILNVSKDEIWFETGELQQPVSEPKK
ncbi:hypothetical protein [Pedobacter frigoris]|uniref:hypothetical protein n=1 Tax=Pedobacter frigoris TaxID=2571272 RepID=UPI00292ED675|nr:hypothetical protein [Pedobacter frigoris]